MRMDTIGGVNDNHAWVSLQLYLFTKHSYLSFEDRNPHIIDVLTPCEERRKIVMEVYFSGNFNNKNNNNNKKKKSGNTTPLFHWKDSGKGRTMPVFQPRGALQENLLLLSLNNLHMMHSQFICNHTAESYQSSVDVAPLLKPGTASIPKIQVMASHTFTNK